MAMPMNQNYSLWLMPTKDQSRLFSTIIHDLARQYDTPVFEPHATLCSGTFAGELSVLYEQVDQLGKEWYPVSLDVRGIEQTDDYFRFLFVALTDNHDPSIFRQAIQTIPNSLPPSVGPHLSLMYSDRIKEIDRARISQAVRRQLPDRVLFSTIQVVMPGTGNWRDVGCWQVRYTAPPGSMGSVVQLVPGRKPSS